MTLTYEEQVLEFLGDARQIADDLYFGKREFDTASAWLISIKISNAVENFKKIMDGWEEEEMYTEEELEEMNQRW